MEKLEWWSTRRWKNFEDMYRPNRLDIIPECDGQTDKRTDRHLATDRHLVRAMHTRRAVQWAVLLWIDAWFNWLHLLSLTNHWLLSHANRHASAHSPSIFVLYIQFDLRLQYTFPLWPCYCPQSSMHMMRVDSSALFPRKVSESCVIIVGLTWEPAVPEAE